MSGGAGSGGTITGLDGSTLATAIHNSVGYPGSVSSELIAFCTSFTDYIMDNASAEYTSGNVTAICPAGGGSISAGSASGGTIS